MDRHTVKVLRGIRQRFKILMGIEILDTKVGIEIMETRERMIEMLDMEVGIEMLDMTVVMGMAMLDIT